MSADGPSGLGDVVRAYGALHPDPATAGRIARLLGYTLAEGHRTPGPGRERARATGEPSMPTVARRPLTRSESETAPTPRDNASDDNSPRTTPWRRYLRPVGRFSVPREGGEEGLPVDAPTMLPPAPPTPPQPLLRPGTAARVLETLVATNAHDGDVEVDLVIAALATRRQLTSLPRGERRSLMRGVQVLTDVSEAMMPYTDDSEHVLAVLRTTVGRGHVQRLSFDGAVAYGAGSGSSWSWGAYVPPAPGTPVLALAELGLAAVAGRLVGELQDSWLDLHELLRRRGSALVVLTPFHPSRWPRRLAGTIELVHWDRSCSMSTAHLLARRRAAQGSDPR